MEYCADDGDVLADADDRELKCDFLDVNEKRKSDEIAERHRNRAELECCEVFPTGDNLADHR
jgi:hypothetical protein